jgi:serine/threonine-protein kinase
MTVTPDTDERAAATTDPGRPARPGREGELIAGRYRLIELLGEGAMGTVYRARHEGLQRVVAMKFLQDELAGNREVAARFAREAIAAARLQHPNVIAVYDSGADEQGRCFLAMEYLAAESLRALMERVGAVPRARALGIAAQVAAALDHAHGLGIVHRDVKPENVLVLDVEGVETVKVIDFGIAKVFQPDGPSTPGLTRTGIVLGTPEYIAPEQAAGAEVDHRADIYALAVMTYELLVGGRPFDSDDVMALLMAHLNATAPAMSARRPDLGFPPAVDAVMARALAKSPADRPQRASEFVAQLDAAFDAPASERTPTEPAPPDEPAAPEPAPPAAAPALVAAPPVVAALPVAPAARGLRALPRGARLALAAAAVALPLAVVALATRGRPRADEGGAAVSPAPRLERPRPEEREAAADDLANRVDALRDRPDLPVATARDRQATARALELLRAGAPADPAPAFALGAVYARDRATHAAALAAYRDAVNMAPPLADRPPMVDDVVRIYAASPPLAATARELLRGPLAPYAAGALADAFLRGGAGRSRLGALLEEAPFAGALDPTQRRLIALAGARSCEAKRAVVEAMGREADARALPALRRIPIGSGCGFLGLGTCNPCLGSAVPAAIRAIEARAGDAG